MKKNILIVTPIYPAKDGVKGHTPVVHYFAKDVNGSEGIYVYDGNNWFIPNMYYNSPFENGSESVADWLTLVGTTEDFLTKVGSVPDVNFLAADENTSRKYYLKSNGKEV